MPVDLSYKGMFVDIFLCGGFVHFRDIAVSSLVFLVVYGLLFL